MVRKFLNVNSKFISGDDFNDLILLGVDKESKASAEDIVKLQAIRLMAVGEESRAVALVYKFYEKQGFTQEIARQFVFELMKQNPFKELEEAIRALFYHHQKSAKSGQELIAWKAGLGAAVSMLKAYTRKFKMTDEGEKVMKEVDGKQVPEFIEWNQSKIDNFIDRCIKETEKVGLIPKGAFDAYKKSLTPKKEDKDSEESVSKKDAKNPKEEGGKGAERNPQKPNKLMENLKRRNNQLRERVNRRMNLKPKKVEAVQLKLPLVIPKTVKHQQSKYTLQHLTENIWQRYLGWKTLMLQPLRTAK